MSLDLLKMRYFVRIAELGSITRASVDLGVAQPALSFHMRMLEEQLGVQLLIRNARGVIATEAGMTLLEHAQSILRALDKAEAATREQAEFPTGEVSLGIISSVAPRIAVPLIEECSAKFPKISLRIAEGDSQALRSGVDTGIFNLVVNLRDVAKPTATPLFDEPLFVVGPPGYFEASKKKLRIADVLALPLILPTRRHGIRILLEREALRLEIDLKVSREIEGVATTKQAIRAGLGITVLGEGAVMGERDLSGLSVLPVVPTLRRAFVLDMPSDNPPTRAVQSIESILVKLFREG